MVNAYVTTYPLERQQLGQKAAGRRKRDITSTKDHPVYHEFFQLLLLLNVISVSI